MSEPKRFDYLSDGMWENSAGDFVLHSDYANLKAEVERLISVSEAWKKRRLDKVEAECIDWSDYEKLKSENARLKAEVERLRKAGDALVEAIKEMDVIIDMDSNHPEVSAWNAAKEGKPSV